jgi:hypothetical protein
MRILTILILFLHLHISSKASTADLFSFDEASIQQIMMKVTEVEQMVLNTNLNIENSEQLQALGLSFFHPETEQKTAGDSFFKGLTLGCFGVFDSYLSHDKEKYKRGPLWTGCCLNSMLVGSLYYLLDTNYFHLIPPGS